MDKITVDAKPVPIPPIHGHRGAHKKYPWEALKKPGDSFFVRANGREPRVLVATLIGCARHGYKVTTRQMDGGVRVWRVS